ncbi:hypothetical protein MSAN_00132500 [Mycena sanguinolenta]|uniref:Uncharacterized protein n=1 Tax=Mycena sanguinolenta TaxID=230812 RepID=A0A8H6ZGX6_9AGAR|nr:hypothetical protein MSAN_00132500 [Mycena sanguinolenta]
MRIEHLTVPFGYIPSPPSFKPHPPSALIIPSPDTARRVARDGGDDDDLTYPPHPDRVVAWQHTIEAKVMLCHARGRAVQDYADIDSRASECEMQSLTTEEFLRHIRYRRPCLHHISHTAPISSAHVSTDAPSPYPHLGSLANPRIYHARCIPSPMDDSQNVYAAFPRPPPSLSRADDSSAYVFLPYSCLILILKRPCSFRVRRL